MAHTCMCRSCSPGLFPVPPQIGAPGYYTLDDVARVDTVTIDGLAEPRVRECVEGKRGWAIVLSQYPHAHVCKCYEGVCEQVVRGRVRVMLCEAEAS